MSNQNHPYQMPYVSGFGVEQALHMSLTDSTVEDHSVEDMREASHYPLVVENLFIELSSLIQAERRSAGFDPVDRIRADFLVSEELCWILRMPSPRAIQIKDQITGTLVPHPYEGMRFGELIQRCLIEQWAVNRDRAEDWEEKGYSKIEFWFGYGDARRMEKIFDWEPGAKATIYLKLEKI